MESIWQRGLSKPEFPMLEGEQKCDVLIIGGGLCGLLCGYLLKNAGVDCLIVEADTVCGGTTHNTTAKLTSHHGAIFDTMIERYGVEATRLYWEVNEQAIKQYQALAAHIDCDFENTLSYVYSRTNRNKIEKEVAALRKLGCPAEFTTKLPLPFPTVGAVSVPGQAQFHPLKFAYSLAKELPVFEHTKVSAIREGIAYTERASIKAKTTIVTTHFPFLNRHGLYFLKMYQHRSYVLALANAPTPQGSYVDENERGLSFRGYGEVLLLGGGGHRTGKQEGGWRELSEFAEAYYPKSRVISRYAAQDCMTLDDIPYIGPYSPNTPSLYVATGFNKWGMTSCMVAANLLRDQILGKQNPYSAIFSPSRSIWHKQLPVNACESFLGLITPTVPRCTHLGCALHYNKQEHSWDCGCHGSRFAKDGQVLDGPAVKHRKSR